MRQQERMTDRQRAAEYGARCSLWLQRLAACVAACQPAGNGLTAHCAAQAWANSRLAAHYGRQVLAPTMDDLTEAAYAAADDAE